jgi:hypothetical protein
MTTPQHIRAGKLVKLLASDKPGEVAAAAAALNRVIIVAGHDIHWLANIVEGALQVPLVPGAPGDEDVSWQEALAHCLDHIHELDPRSQAFLRSLSRWRGEPSQKQLYWLLDIYARVHGERR